ncbi:zinc-binding dehydrogenase [Microbacterium sp. No. 7]|uniref:zinc-binding dehydrogenase n=1 Tax=Microbacterium sp. No. 7 TaxID=1714373 RepID=UPI0006ED2807|nr:zinc-binding dehydrogenase [Microbacterium sp. No. 7]ALJ18869.1 hypothetical protein AOA12_02660 [Microbacterium sp. No. 7]
MSTAAHDAIDGTTRARAALLVDREGHSFTITEVDVSAPGDGEVLVDIRASSLCHSDWNFVVNDYGHPLPALLGHEIAGVVREVGPGVVDVAVGDHVVACVVPSCGRCEKCLEGERVQCLDPQSSQRSPGAAPRVTRDGGYVWQMQGLGGFSDRALIHESQLVRVDPAVPLDRAAVLGCGVVTGAGAVLRSADVRPRETVVVFGAGGVGLSAAQAAAIVGARKVIVVDIEDGRLELARRFGATHVINGATQDVVAEIRALTGGRGVDHAFEMTGLPGPLQQAYAVLGARGTVYLIGMQPVGSTFPLPADSLSTEASVRAVKMGSTNFKVDIPYYAELYLQGRFNLDDLVSAHIPLDRINEAYADMLAGSTVGRTVIVFD